VHILTARWCSVSGLLPGEQVKADEVTVVNDVALRDPPEDNKRRDLKGSSHKSTYINRNQNELLDRPKLDYMISAINSSANYQYTKQYVPGSTGFYLFYII
jgi:hypothetical protein